LLARDYPEVRVVALARIAASWRVQRRHPRLARQVRAASNTRSMRWAMGGVDAFTRHRSQAVASKCCSTAATPSTRRATLSNSTAFRESRRWQKDEAV
jgi:hypothetical protein